METWGDVYNRHKANGMDQSDAAFRADEWEKRQAMNVEEELMATNEALVRKLAEARAQIANLRAMSRAKSDEIEHRDAQIAAKDAALREGSSQWLLDAVANWKKRAEEAEARLTEGEHMRESLAWYAKREADLLARAEKAEAQIAAKDAALRPLAALQIPAKPQGNAGAYSIFHKDIEAARQALAAPARERDDEI